MALSDKARKSLIRLADGWTPNNLTFSMMMDESAELQKRGHVAFQRGSIPDRGKLCRDGGVELKAGNGRWVITARGKRAAAQFRSLKKKRGSKTK